MKKMIIASALALLSVGFAEAGLFGRGYCNNGPRRMVRRTAVADCPPKCYKTIMVPETIQVAKCVEVPARKIVIPQPDIIERIPQKPVEVRIPQPAIPQPDRIEYRCVPDQIRHIKQAPCVRYECPADCN